MWVALSTAVPTPPLGLTAGHHLPGVDHDLAFVVLGALGVGQDETRNGWTLDMDDSFGRGSSR